MLISDIVRDNARFFADRDAVVVPDGDTTSWGALDERTDRMANAFRALGLAKGDRIAVHAPNSPTYVEFFFACAKSGVVGAPTNTRLTAYELAAYLSYVEPAAVLVHADLAEAARAWLPELPSVRHVLGFGGAHGLDLDLDAAIAAAEPTPPAVRVDEDDVYQLGATSGTTGVPKGAILTQRNATAAILTWAADLPVPERGTALQNIPHFFNPGGPAGLHPVLLKGGRTVILPGFEPGLFLRTVQRYRVTSSILVPTMVQMVLNHPECERYDLSSLSSVMSGGSPFPAPLLSRAREVFGDVFFPLYGMAETYSCGMVLRPENQFPDGDEVQRRRLGSAGKPTSGTHLRVVDAGGRDVPHDNATHGEIWMRGDSISPGYFRMPDETAAARQDGWFRSGDIAVVDDEGYITIVDRAKDMIITGGINVFSIEVERVLLDHPAVASAAVVGVPHPTWGESIHAVLVLRAGASATKEEILAFAGTRLAGFKKPRTADVVPALPVSATGKVLKRELRDRYATPVRA